MSKRLMSLGLLPLVALAVTAGVKGRQASDEQTVQAFLNRYVQAMAAGDRGALERFFWPGATIAGVVPDSSGVDQLLVQSSTDFVEWMVSTRRQYQRFEFRIVTRDIRIYRDLANARLVLEVKEQRAGEPLETEHSLDWVHLIRQRGEWRVIQHAWAMEAPGAPLVAER